MSQLNNMQNSRQEVIENQLYALGVTIALLEHDELRIRQAISRTGADDLLAPVLADQQRVMALIRKVQDGLSEKFEAGQKTRWNEP